MDLGFFFLGKGGGLNVWYLIIFCDILNVEFNLFLKFFKYIKYLIKDYWCWFWEKFDKFSDVFLWNVIYYGNGFKYKDIELFISEKL